MRRYLALAKGSAKTRFVIAFGIKFLNAGLSFLVTAILARRAGPEIVGYYAFAVSTGGLIGAFALMGLDQVVLRTVAGDLRQGDLAGARAVLRQAVQRVVPVSLAAAGLYLVALYFTPLTGLIHGDRQTLAVAALAIVLYPVWRVGLAGVRGAGLPLYGQFLDGCVQSLLLVVAYMVVLGAGARLTAALATGLFLCGMFLSAAWSWGVVRRVGRSWPEPCAPRLPHLFGAGLPFMVLMVTNSMAEWIAYAVVGGTADAAAVGAFRVAVQMSTIIALVATTAETYVAPGYAGDFREGNFQQAWRRHRQSSLFMAALAGAPVVLCMLFPQFIVGTLFGSQFLGAALPLQILAAGQAANVCFGPVGAMLSMSNHERLLLATSLSALVVLAVVSIVLVPRFGTAGAAAAVSSTLAYRNLVAYLLARHFLPASQRRWPEADDVPTATA